MEVEGNERIWPKRENLEEYLQDTPEHKQRYDLASNCVQELDCADVACGAGYGSFMLSKSAKRVSGYDISKEALDHANDHFKTSEITFEHITNFQNKQFEAVVSFETLEHMNEEDGNKFLSNIYNNLKPEGYLIISTPLNETNFRENVTKYHIREYNNFEFKTKLNNAGFEIKKWYGQSNSVSKKISKKVLGISLITILNFGVHRLIPKFLRSPFSKYILGKNKPSSRSIIISEDTLDGAFSQIAICRKR